MPCTAERTQAFPDLPSGSPGTVPRFRRECSTHEGLSGPRPEEGLETPSMMAVNPTVCVSGIRSPLRAVRGSAAARCVTLDPGTGVAGG